MSICAAINFNGRLQVFRVGLDNQIFHAVENTPGGGFGVWEQLEPVSDTTPANIDATTDSAGFIQVCRSAPDGNVYIARQLLKGAYISAWTRLPHPPQGAGMIKYGIDADGTTQLFLIGADRMLYHSRQELAGGTWSSWFPVTPGVLSYRFAIAGGLADLTITFTTEEVFDLTTARNWRGQLEAFVRGHRLTPLHVSHQVIPVVPNFVDDLDDGLELRFRRFGGDRRGLPEVFQQRSVEAVEDGEIRLVWKMLAFPRAAPKHLLKQDA